MRLALTIALVTLLAGCTHDEEVFSLGAFFGVASLSLIVVVGAFLRKPPKESDEPVDHGWQ